MQSVLEIILPVFGLILCGYLVARTSILSREGIHGLSAFVFNVATPALLFRAMLRNFDTAVIEINMIYGYFGACIIGFALVYFLGGRVFNLARAERALMAMSSVFSNTVMLGIPLIFMAFGEQGLFAITVIIAFHGTILVGGTTIVIEIGREGQSGVAALGQAVRALARNPIILSVIMGLLWAEVGLPLPTVLGRFIDLLSGAAAPCALFSLGAAMTLYSVRGEMKEILAVSFLKLFALPPLVWLLCKFVFLLPHPWLAVAVIAAALPTGANVYLLAQRYDVYVARSASSVVVSTAASAITLALLIAYFTP